jgi:hypothetical protein
MIHENISSLFYIQIPFKKYKKNVFCAQLLIEGINIVKKIPYQFLISTDRNFKRK